jgi:hypothetical protein
MFPFSYYRHDPGPCPVDDAPHTTCHVDDGGALVIPQLPCRDALAAKTAPPPPTATVRTGEPFSTKSYRRKRP